jgi:hypothetical protein
VRAGADRRGREVRVRIPGGQRRGGCAEAAQVVVDDRAIKVTNLDKVMYATGTTKGE